LIARIGKREREREGDDDDDDSGRDEKEIVSCQRCMQYM
jgi:hypothetical protein